MLRQGKAHERRDAEVKHLREHRDSLSSTGRQSCSELSDWPFELSRVLYHHGGMGSLALCQQLGCVKMWSRCTRILSWLCFLLFFPWDGVITSAYTLGVTVRTKDRKHLRKQYWVEARPWGLCCQGPRWACKSSVVAPEHNVVWFGSSSLGCSITLCGLGMRLSMGMWWYSSHWMATHHHISMDCSSHYLGILPIF